MDVHASLASRLRALRRTQGLSLEALATRSGVSRSNISLIERGESSPTAVVLDRLATALGQTLASLFTSPAAPGTPPAAQVRAADQPLWTDPDSGYVRRHLSPPAAHAIQLVAVEFPAGQRVAYETAAREPAVEQQVWLMDGRLEVTEGDSRWQLAPGDCLVMRLQQPVSFHNPGPGAARYLVALTAPAGGSRAHAMAGAGSRRAAVTEAAASHARGR